MISKNCELVSLGFSSNMLKEMIHSRTQGRHNGRACKVLFGGLVIIHHQDALYELIELNGAKEEKSMMSFQVYCRTYSNSMIV